jgi:predicted DNA-binding ribbon-helix-helix protein
MSRKGTKTITVDEEFYTSLQQIADRNNLYVNKLVEQFFKQTFPGDFPEKAIV